MGKRRWRQRRGMMAHEARGVTLYRTPERWRFSVLDTGGGIACGALSDTSPTSSFEAAETDLRAILRSVWGFKGDLVWTQTEDDWWMADATPQSTDEVPQ
jgi:hypothetical protein